MPGRVLQPALHSRSDPAQPGVQREEESIFALHGGGFPGPHPDDRVPKSLLKTQGLGQPGQNL